LGINVCLLNNPSIHISMPLYLGALHRGSDFGFTYFLSIFSAFLRPALSFSLSALPLLCYLATLKIEPFYVT
jgi:hypothetical protein